LQASKYSIFSQLITESVITVYYYHSQAITML